MTLQQLNEIAELRGWRAHPTKPAVFCKKSGADVLSVAFHFGELDAEGDWDADRERMGLKKLTDDEVKDRFGAAEMKGFRVYC